MPVRLAELSAFNAADRHVPRLLLALVLCCLVAALAVAAPLPGAAGAMCAGIGASLAVTAAGFAGAACIGVARRLALRAEHVEDAGSAEGLAMLTGSMTRAGGSAFRRANRLATWQQVGASGGLAGLATAAAWFAWHRGTAWDLAANHAALGVAACLPAAFAVLVLERHLASFSPSELPEAPSLSALLRLPIAVLLVCGLGCMLLYAGVRAGALAGRFSCVLSLVVATELLIRAGATLFVPFPPISEARGVAVSVIAGALRLRQPPAIGATVRNWFGIDLSRSWALAFMRGAAAPVAAVLTLFTWSLTGVSALRLDQRAIYERLGRPVAVLGPGLHVHLPWPLGRLRPVELGVMHDVPIVYDLPGDLNPPAPARPGVPDAEAHPGTLADRLWDDAVRSEGAQPVVPTAGISDARPGAAPPGLPGAEDRPGVAADRLWDQAHPSEAAYLVASTSRGQQSFESVDIDLRVVYRIGLSDQAAIRAAYATSDLQRLVQSKSSRLLAHYFAGHTLPGVLGADQASFSHDIGATLQAELDRVDAGVDVMAVVVEAVHPPPGAASAYHAVQTAAIAAHTAIAEQAAIAAASDGEARKQVGDLRDMAAAHAREAVVAARVQAILFGADRSANARDGATFLLERRLDRLGAGLAHRQLLIIDHRLRCVDAPTIDLRPPGSAAASPDLPSRPIEP